MGGQGSGRKRKPTRLKVIEGNRGHRPLEPDAEPQFSIPDDMPSPPSFLDPYAVEEWERVAPELYANGLLTVVDAAALGAYCQAASTWRQASEELELDRKANDRAKARGLVIETKQGNRIQNPLLGIANKARADMVKLGSEFGLTPSARASLEGSKRGDEDPTESKFFGRK